MTKLLVDAGRACDEYQDRVLVNLSCKRIQVDQIWAFCHCKQANVPENKKGMPGYGDIWTRVALDPETKLVPSWFVGSGDLEHAYAFIADLKDRLATASS